jgi:hypothetical protein
VNALTTIQTVTAVAAQGQRRDGVRVATPPELSPWRRAYDERQAAWNTWRATRPAVGYVVHRMNEALGAQADPAQRLRGQAAYAAQAARALSIEGPVGAVSLLV